MSNNINLELLIMLNNSKKMKDGGQCSGNFGHSGIPGQVGGSQPQKGFAEGSVTLDDIKEFLSKSGITKAELGKYFSLSPDELRQRVEQRNKKGWWGYKDKNDYDKADKLEKEMEEKLKTLDKSSPDFNALDIEFRKLNKQNMRYRLVNDLYNQMSQKYANTIQSTSESSEQSTNTNNEGINKSLDNYINNLPHFIKGDANLNRQKLEDISNYCSQLDFNNIPENRDIIDISKILLQGNNFEKFKELIANNDGKKYVDDIIKKNDQGADKLLQNYDINSVNDVVNYLSLLKNYDTIDYLYRISNFDVNDLMEDFNKSTRNLIKDIGEKYNIDYEDSILDLRGIWQDELINNFNDGQGFTEFNFDYLADKRKYEESQKALEDYVASLGDKVPDNLVEYLRDCYKYRIKGMVSYNKTPIFDNIRGKNIDGVLWDDKNVGINNKALLTKDDLFAKNDVIKNIIKNISRNTLHDIPGLTSALANLPQSELDKLSSWRDSEDFNNQCIEMHKNPYKHTLSYDNIDNIKTAIANYYALGIDRTLGTNSIESMLTNTVLKNKQLNNDLKGYISNTIKEMDNFYANKLIDDPNFILGTIGWTNNVEMTDDLKSMRANDKQFKDKIKQWINGQFLANINYQRRIDNGVYTNQNHINGTNGQLIGMLSNADKQSIIKNLQNNDDKEKVLFNGIPDAMNNIKNLSKVNEAVSKLDENDIKKLNKLQSDSQFITDVYNKTDYYIKRLPDILNKDNLTFDDLKELKACSYANTKVQLDKLLDYAGSQAKESISFNGLNNDEQSKFQSNFDNAKKIIIDKCCHNNQSNVLESMTPYDIDSLIDKEYKFSSGTESLSLINRNRNRFSQDFLQAFLLDRVGQMVPPEDKSIANINDDIYHSRLSERLDELTDDDNKTVTQQAVFNGYKDAVNFDVSKIKNIGDVNTLNKVNYSKKESDDILDKLIPGVEKKYDVYKQEAQHSSIKDNDDNQFDKKIEIRNKEGGNLFTDWNNHSQTPFTIKIEGSSDPKLNDVNYSGKYIHNFLSAMTHGADTYGEAKLSNIGGIASLMNIQCANAPKLNKPLYRFENTEEGFRDYDNLQEGQTIEMDAQHFTYNEEFKKSAKQWFGGSGSSGVMFTFTNGAPLQDLEQFTGRKTTKEYEGLVAGPCKIKKIKTLPSGFREIELEYDYDNIKNFIELNKRTYGQATSPTQIRELKINKNNYTETDNNVQEYISNIKSRGSQKYKQENYNKLCKDFKAIGCDNFSDVLPMSCISSRNRNYISELFNKIKDIQENK